MNVFAGQVGRPEANRRVAFLEEDFERRVVVVANRRGNGFLVEVERRSVFVKQETVNFKRNLRRVVGDAATPGRGDNAAPVRVGAANRRLDERVVGDRLRQFFRRLAVGRAEHVDRNEVRRAFAVPRNHRGEFLAEVEQQRFERR